MLRKRRRVVAVNRVFFYGRYRAPILLTNPGNKYFRWRQWRGDLNYEGCCARFFNGKRKEVAQGTSVLPKLSFFIFRAFCADFDGTAVLWKYISGVKNELGRSGGHRVCLAPDLGIAGAPCTELDKKGAKTGGPLALKVAQKRDVE